MLDFISTNNPKNALEIIKQDHKKVKELFEQFEKADDKRSKKKIAAQAIGELKIHAEIEEKLFYPAVRKSVEKDLMNEADEEHHVAKLLIAELENLDAADDHWEAKFIVLAENIRHHIKEEEGEMLPQARKSELDFDSLGAEILDMKAQLKKIGLPQSDEEKLISGNQKADSPAKAASHSDSHKSSASKPHSSKQKKASAKDAA